VDVIPEITVCDVRKKVNQRQDQPQREDRENEKVKRRIEASVIRQGLGFCFGHEGLLA
jgi:hypothetical protein